jgi:hypothetical protein
MVGKTNMDQFAAGLVGTRTPYGIPKCAFDDRFIPGGSSSGSGSIVGARLVTFALGTDTAGSGDPFDWATEPFHPADSLYLGILALLGCGCCVNTTMASIASRFNLYMNLHILHK